MNKGKSKKSLVQRIKEKAKNAKERLKYILKRKSSRLKKTNIYPAMLKKGRKVNPAINKEIPMRENQKNTLKKKVLIGTSSKKGKKRVKASLRFKNTKSKNRPIVLAISGTPGTGKTTVARRIEKEFDILHLDVNSIIKEYSLSEGYDPVRRCEIIDINKLKKALILLILKAKRPIIIDSHMSHFLPKKYIDVCIITKCSPKTLNERLLKRSYHDAKIRENLDSEIFEVCMNEAVEEGHEIIEINTDSGIDFAALKDKLKILKYSKHLK
jgi:adenylate kinase